MRISEDELRGRTVIGSDGLAIGDVETIYLDTRSWEVTGIGTKLRKEVAKRLGYSSNPFKSAGLTIPTRMVQSVSDAIILSVPIGDLRGMLPEGQEQSAHH